MAGSKAFKLLVATDGSDRARGVLATAANFPWPARTHVRVVAARRTGAAYTSSMLLAALDRSAEIAAENARRTLARRWPDVEAAVVDTLPVEGILDEAKRFAADAIVLGWRGHGALQRLLMGSVSRGVVRGATCPVLVVRRSTRVRRIVVAFDGSAMAKRALAFVGRLTPPPHGRVVLAHAVELMPVPSRTFVPGARIVVREVKRTNTRRGKAALRALEQAAAALERGGWQTSTVLTSGEPLRDLLRTVASTRAQLLVVGARGTSGARYLLLGSVAEGALNRCPVPVLVAR